MVSLPIDDQDAAVYSVGQVAEMLHIPQAFLRRLDELAVVCPARSAGGQRRYSRRQISGVQRARVLAAQGLTLAGIRQVLALEDQISQLEASLAAARAEAARLRAELAQPGQDMTGCLPGATEGGSRECRPDTAACGAARMLR
jgi:MerR family transcriptional regulator, heat shock protein HspR